MRILSQGDNAGNGTDGTKDNDNHVDDYNDVDEVVTSQETVDFPLRMFHGYSVRSGGISCQVKATKAGEQQYCKYL